MLGYGYIGQRTADRQGVEAWMMMGRRGLYLYSERVFNSIYVLQGGTVDLVCVTLEGSRESASVHLDSVNSINSSERSWYCTRENWCGFPRGSTRSIPSSSYKAGPRLDLELRDLVALTRLELVVEHSM